MGEDVKAYKTYAEQVALLESRGMDMGDHDTAMATLRRVNYYRLSGYWYPFRMLSSSGRQDDFYGGTRFSDVVALYDFHHNQKYGGRLPVWAATELLDWGSLTYLYGFAPRDAQDVVADACGLTAPQLTSWFKALNLVRNTCAHHGRLFNRVHTISPKLPRIGRHPDLDAVSTDWSRTFGQLTLVQFLADRLGPGRSKLLPAVMKSFPTVQIVPLSHVGALEDWQSASPLWS